MFGVAGTSLRVIKVIIEGSLLQEGLLGWVFVMLGWV